MSNKIKHAGIIDTIGDKYVRVKILQNSACNECKVASHCNASDTKEKMIDIQVCKEHNYKQGDKVVISAKKSVAFKAEFFAYIFPLAIMLISLFTIKILTANEPLAALSSLCSLAVYYMILFFTKKKIQSGIHFEIE